MQNVIYTKINNDTDYFSVYNSKFQYSFCSIHFHLGRIHLTDREYAALHILEHLILEGNKRHQSVEDIFFSGSSYINGEINFEDSAFYFKTKDVELKKKLDIFFNLIFSPNITEDAVESEKSIILEEWDESHDIGDYLSQKLFNEIWTGTKFSSPDKEREQIVLITLKDLKAIYQKLLNAYKVIVIANAKSDIQIGDYQLHGIKHEKVILEPKAIMIHEKLPKVSAVFMHDQQIGVGIVYNSMISSWQELIKIQIINSLLNGSNQYLVKKIRNNQKMAYSVEGDLTIYTNLAMFSVNVVCAKQKVNEVIYNFIDVIKQMEYLDKHSINKAVNSELELYDESFREPEFWGDFINTFCQRGLIMTNALLADYLKYFKELDLEALRQENDRLFSDKHFYLRVIGDYSLLDAQNLRDYIGTFLKQKIYLSYNDDYKINKWTERIKSWLTI